MNIGIQMNWLVVFNVYLVFSWDMVTWDDDPKSPKSLVD